MKKIFKIISTAILFAVIVFSASVSSFAHPGNTDKNGGHKDNKNKSGLGYYHYHCGGYPAHLHTQGYCPYKDIFPTSVTVSAEKTAIKPGESISIEASVLPGNCCNSNVTWSCSNSDVISLSDGVITAKSYGTATVTAESFNGIKGSVKITVMEITAEKVEITGSESLAVGEEEQLGIIIMPENVTNQEIKWSVDNTEIATISEQGVLTALSEGTVTVTAEQKDITSSYEVSIIIPVIGESASDSGIEFLSDDGSEADESENDSSSLSFIKSGRTSVADSGTKVSLGDSNNTALGLGCIAVITASAALYIKKKKR